MARTSSFATVLEEITAGVQAVTPEQILPPEGASELKAGQKPILVCDDYLKRLFTYHKMRATEANVLLAEGQKLKKEVLEACRSGRKEPREINSLKDLIGSIVGNLREPGPDEQAKIERMEQIDREVAPQARFISLLGDIFWAEVRNRAPEGVDVGNITLCSDWSVVSRNPADEVADLFDELAGKLRSGEAAAA